MKPTLYSALILIISLCSTPAFCQINPFTNSLKNTTNGEPVQVSEITDLISYSSASGVACTDNSFWAIASTGVDLFTLNGDVITKVGTTVITGAFDPNLAFCNNLNGGAFGPTFYSTKNSNQPVYFDGSGVINAPGISPNKLFNCGGYGSFLYFIMYDDSYQSKAIVRYNGSTFTSVYNLPETVMTTVADLAVDSTGNVWFFTGIKNDTIIETDTLNVVSPGGQMIKQYPFPFNTDNAFGCFLLHGKLYLGLGKSNPVHPYTILPLTLTSVSVTAGTPIPMPVTTSYSDMASCNTGSPLSITEHYSLPGISIYPNPVIDKLMINSNSSDFKDVILYDITSREILHQSFINSVTLDLKQFTKGIYLYEIKNKTGGIMTGKVVKE